MKDEKQMLEIAKILCNNNFCRRSEFVDCQYLQGTYCPRCINAATALYDADYRKVIHCKDCADRNTEGCQLAYWDGGELVSNTEDDGFCCFARAKGKTKDDEQRKTD